MQRQKTMEQHVIITIQLINQTQTQRKHQNTKPNKDKHVQHIKTNKNKTNTKQNKTHNQKQNTIEHKQTQTR